MLAIVPVADLAQRDHLFAVFAFPYVLLLGIRLDRFEAPRKLALTVGVFAFFGVALKPYFLILPLALACAVVIRTRRWTHLFRAESMALGACLSIYALSVAAFYPEYFTVVLPRYMKLFFAFTQPLGALIAQVEVSLAAVALIAYFCKRQQAHCDHGVILALIIAAMASVVIFVLQKKAGAINAHLR